MVLVVDNYDSFTYNLVQYLGEMVEVKVARNDKIDIKQIKKMNPSHIVISPGPGRPKNAGISTDIISYFKDKIPILGVCLGHQCIGKVFGAEIIQADKLFHGKVSKIKLIKNNYKLFSEIETPFIATRYHSLIIDEKTVPEELEVIAKTNAGEIMAVAHRDFPVYGVQFHPESILTETGKKLLNNFININLKGENYNV